MASGDGPVEVAPLYCYDKQRNIASHVLRNRQLLDASQLEAIRKNIPESVFQPSKSKATLQVLLLGCFLIPGFWLQWTIPATGDWYLMPISCILLGLALNNAFLIGHDCVHGNWTASPLVNAIAGEICFTALLHPYQSFKHVHLNHIISDRVVGTVKGKAHTISRSKAHSVSLLAEIGLVRFFAQFYNPWRFPEEGGVRRKVVASILVSVCVIATATVASIVYIGMHAPITCWLIPMILYKDVFFIKVLSFVRNGCRSLLPVEIATNVASYHLIEASLYIRTALESDDDEDEDEGEAFVQPPQAPRMSAEDWERKPLYMRVNWLHVAILILTPILALLGWRVTPLDPRTAWWSLFYYFFTGLGITAGYHRLWAHRAYTASFPVRLLLAFAGTGAMQGSIKWWVGGHRVHHRYTDTDFDPYDAKKGFWWSHVGWMAMLPNPAYKLRSNINDIRASPLVQFQHRHYLFLTIFISFIFPCLVAGFAWGDFKGGLVYAGLVRQVLLHHATFCINSLAHNVGDQNFDDHRTPRDNLLTALITFGEGYHNFHHEFPNDWRNGIRWYDYDPTKWLIKAFSIMGLAFDLKEATGFEIEMGKVSMSQKKLDERRRLLQGSVKPAALPIMSWSQIRAEVEDGRALIVVEGLVHDVSSFVEDHPGGITYIRSQVGKDGSDAFKGRTGIYQHSSAASHLLGCLRVAKLEGGGSDPDIASIIDEEEVETVTDTPRRRSSRLHRKA